jgi:hypothetical protein
MQKGYNLIRGAGAQMELFYEKNGGRKSRDKAPLRHNILIQCCRTGV